MAIRPLDLQLDLLDAEREQRGWQVRESRRARRLSVRVFPGGRVEIVVPVGTRPRTVQQFVSRHRGWIDRKVDEFRHAGADREDTLPTAVDFRATGHRFEVSYLPTDGAPRLEELAGRIMIHGDLDREALLRHALQRWLLRTAHDQLVPRLISTADRHALGFKRAQVRRQRTRWGSCSRSGTISINACLMFQSPEVVRYLFVHELAHTVHMNHSRRFWRLVERLEPAWRHLDRELSKGWRHVPHWAIG